MSHGRNVNQMRRVRAKAIVFTAFLGALPALAFAPSAEARSKAAQWLADREIAEACESGRGSIDPSGVIERDLDGDGRDDLIISHEAISCEGEMARSLFCGMQVCSVKFYLRRGELLKPELEMLGAGVEVGSGQVPAISMYAHGGARGSVRWSGNGFE